jgi:hypothetical protein
MGNLYLLDKRKVRTVKFMPLPQRLPTLFYDIGVSEFVEYE